MTPAGSAHIECITWNGESLCYIVRRELTPQRTMFLTPPESAIQVGYVVRRAAEDIPRHAHRPTVRTITTTSEVLFVQRGRCELDVYTDDREYVTTRELREGDLVIIVGGGHGFRIIEDTVLLEVKQGPYAGAGDRDRF
jgi:hypothetical protein